MPKYNFQMPNIPQPRTPELDFLKMKPEPLKYENSIFKQMADDVKSPLEQQLESLQMIAESAQRQADAAQTQAKLAEEAAENAKADAIIARKEARFAKIVSVMAIITPIVYDFIRDNWTTILQLLSELFAK